MKSGNGTGGSRETSTGGLGSRPGRRAVDARGHESINIFVELKRRNVYKVAVAYAVVGWLVIQAASIFLPAFDAPPWVMKIFIIVIVLGSPVALVLSWAFEITPEGIKRESEVPPNESIRRRTGRKIVGITFVLAVIAAGLLAFNLFRTKPTTPPTTAVPITNKSVAVLAFANLSDDKGSEYFSDGISEELLTVLQKNSRPSCRRADFGVFVQRQERHSTGDRAETWGCASGRGKCTQGRQHCAHRGPADSHRHGRATLVGKFYS